ncbi:MAG: succinate dehydrogenase, cytochrome b556 subunit [Proteobacteria bacterium]|nr:succinate dehydrogenase, cytochrome b556 subunit [Pseudomonadota bacterium]
MSVHDRPLSPHLQVYRWPISMTLSILHRVTGVGLGFGTLLMAYWLIAAAAGPDWFATAQTFVGSILGRLILLGFTASLMFHFCNGIRHLFWDAGKGFELSTARASGISVFLGTIILTVATWAIAYLVRGDL